MSITYSTAFYIFKSKFDPTQYLEWANNFLSIVNEFNLVIYTDKNTLPYIKPLVDQQNKSNIKLVIKDIDDFYTFKYKYKWIKNHKINNQLNEHVSWEIIMLYCEKIAFVSETMKNKYFKTDYYGWCDIGYFRNRMNDMNTTYLSNWSNPEIIGALSKNKIHYALVNYNSETFSYFKHIALSKNDLGLPEPPIPDNQVSIAGGFFIAHSSMVEWWYDEFYTKLHKYLKNKYLVKDDQIIILDCVCTIGNENRFEFYTENSHYDNWFLFQRSLK